jgi:hypothetical protein
MRVEFACKLTLCRRALSQRSGASKMQQMQHEHFRRVSDAGSGLARRPAPLLDQATSSSDLLQFEALQARSRTGPPTQPPKPIEGEIIYSIISLHSSMDSGRSGCDASEDEAVADSHRVAQRQPHPCGIGLEARRR